MTDIPVPSRAEATTELAPEFGREEPTGTPFWYIVVSPEEGSMVRATWAHDLICIWPAFKLHDQFGTDQETEREPVVVKESLS
jgi:hypothetical protein